MVSSSGHAIDASFPWAPAADWGGRAGDLLESAVATC